VCGAGGGAYVPVMPQEAEITPEMLRAGREAFQRWQEKWDCYCDRGYPGDEGVAELLSSIFSSMASMKPSE
jgi:hypothetical protein